MKSAFRFGKILFSSPTEAIDRVQIKLAAREGRPENVEQPPRSDWSNWLSVTREWAAAEFKEEFEQIWMRLIEESGNEGRLGQGHDADRALAEATWVLARNLRPRYVVETGVGRGILSHIILAAMESGSRGELHSIDLPPLQEPWYSQSCSAVPEGLRARWRYLRGSSRRFLPQVVAELPHIDLFIHDSLHTRANMWSEFESVWPHIISGGFVIADDADGNDAFATFFDQAPNVEDWIVVQHSHKSGMFGLAAKE